MTPSSSSSFINCKRPSVTATEAWRGFLPVAKAFGAACGTTYSLGTGRFAFPARRLFPGNRLGAARPKRNLIREEIRKAVENDGKSQSDRHALTSAEIAPQRNEKQGQRRQYESGANDFHCCPCVSTNSVSCVQAVSQTTRGDFKDLRRPYVIRFVPQPQVVSPARARSAWRPRARRGPQGRGRPAKPRLPGSAKPGDPEPGAGWSCEAAGRRMPDRSLPRG